MVPEHRPLSAMMTVRPQGQRQWQPQLREPRLKPLNIGLERRGLWLAWRTTLSMLRMNEPSRVPPGKGRGLGLWGPCDSAGWMIKGQKRLHMFFQATFFQLSHPVSPVCLTQSQDGWVSTGTYIVYFSHKTLYQLYFLCLNSKI